MTLSTFTLAEEIWQVTTLVTSSFGCSSLKTSCEQTQSLYLQCLKFQCDSYDAASRDVQGLH